MKESPLKKSLEPGWTVWQLALGFSIVIADQLTKRYVQLTVPLNESVDLPGGFASIVNIENPGAAFGLFRGKGLVSVFVTLIVLFLVIWQRHRIRAEGKAATTGVVLGVSGALGNLIDRLTTGRVIDFVDIHFWPVFNLADVAIVTGVTILMVRVLTSKPTADRVEDR